MTDELRRRIEALSPEKQALLLQRLDLDNADHNPSRTGRQVIAYVAADAGEGPEADELRTFLQDMLPDYMIPATIVHMDTLPRTPNGKVDRKALSIPAQKQLDTDEKSAAPCNDLETKLIDIWADVLGMEQVDVHDNFFELGGDSILSIQIVARARQAGIQITPPQILEYKTIRKLADAAERVDIEPEEQNEKDRHTSSSEEFPDAGLDRKELDQFLDRITGES